MTQLQQSKMSDDKSQNEINEVKEYFITDNKFELLKQFQKTIYEVIEVWPSPRKIVNELITIENLEKVKAKFISAWQNV